MTTPRQILVPTDFSDESNAAKVYATMGWGVDTAYLPQLLERTELNVRERLDEVVTADDRQNVGARVAVETGSPVTKIVEYAEKNGIDLIVMGTHGRGAMERMWVGSVTQGVLQRAACPVVSVQQPRR